MQRREVLTLLGSAVAWPLSAHAQAPGRTARFGVLMSFAENDSEGQGWLKALLQGLKDLGWTDGV